MMRSVTLRRPDGVVMVYATNPTDGGLFVRRESEGAYRQVVGNSQTPYFRSSEQFLAHLRRSPDIAEFELLDVTGW